MGRGRAKAKQTKVARDLKYRSHETDLSALARELHGGESGSKSVEESVEPRAEADGHDDWPDYTESRTGD